MPPQWYIVPIAKYTLPALKQLSKHELKDVALHYKLPGRNGTTDDLIDSILIAANMSGGGELMGDSRIRDRIRRVRHKKAAGRTLAVAMGLPEDHVLFVGPSALPPRPAPPPPPPPPPPHSASSAHAHSHVSGMSGLRMHHPASYARAFREPAPQPQPGRPASSISLLEAPLRQPLSSNVAGIPINRAFVRVRRNMSLLFELLGARRKRMYGEEVAADADGEAAPPPVDSAAGNAAESVAEQERVALAAARSAKRIAALTEASRVLERDCATLSAIVDALPSAALASQALAEGSAALGLDVAALLVTDPTVRAHVEFVARATDAEKAPLAPHDERSEYEPRPPVLVGEQSVTWSPYANIVRV